MAWSRFQNQIYEYAANPENGSFAVQSVAGAGKTTTAVECAKRILASNPSFKILFLAFNKSIVEELERRFDNNPNVRCSTLHSLGLSVIYKSKLKVNVNPEKFAFWMRSRYSKFLDVPLDEKKQWVYIRNCTELLRLCRINLVAPGDESGVSEIAGRHSISTVANETSAVARMLKTVQNVLLFRSQRSGYDIDYTDMITLPLLEGYRKYIPKYDVVFIDEAQDLSAAQQELMLQCVRPVTGKFICVGDRNQAINGFSGSMCNSFEVLAARAGKTLPLSVCYRCGKNIVNEARQYVSEIEPAEGACDGEVVRQKHIRNVMPGDMIVCRKTNPLISLALKLMSEEKSCYVKGRDIAKMLIQLVETAEADGKDNQLSMNFLYMRLDNFVDDLRMRLRSNGIANPENHPAVIDMCDKVDAIRIVGRNCENPAMLKALLDKIFDDNVRGDSIMLSTVHKAKGLEARNVFIICPELLPFRYKDQQPWELQQERNLAYVAITRAQERLTYVDVPENEIENIEC